MITGPLKKMQTALGETVGYQLPIGEQLIDLNQRIGQPLVFSFDGEIRCVACDRKTNKSFNQGHCFPCFRSLAACDRCIMSPEHCHYHLGTCREPEWGEQFCMQPHVVYLANTSGLKVGVTRASQLPTRWLDQGAMQALPIFSVQSRRQAGLLEVALKQYVSDRTQWQRMLKGEPSQLDLLAERDRLLLEAAEALAAVRADFPVQDVVDVTDHAGVAIRYPVEVYPEKVKALNFDKTPEIGGVLQGIKGQYLLLDVGVLNIRKFGGYVVSLSFP